MSQLWILYSEQTAFTSSVSILVSGTYRGAQ